MVSIHTVYEGQLHCQATHGPSSTTLTTDAPVDNQGKGESFSPTDLVATALGACMVTIMGIAANRHGWNLTGTTVDVEKRMIAEPTRRIGKLEVVIRIPARQSGDADGGWGAEQRSALEAAALACPVHASLHPDINIPVRFDWGV